MALYPAGAILLAPLSGYTDLPYRRAVRKCGCLYAFTEMIDASALVYARERTEKMLTRGEDEPWLGVQLVSNNPDHLRTAVRLLNDYNFDVVDFNLGCPVPKVTKKGAGSALGRQVERAVELFKIIADNSTHPVSVKIRILSEDNSDETLQLVQKLADAGAQAITIHGRIAEKFYAGPVAFEIINQAVKAVKIPIIANGGIMGAKSFAEAKANCLCSRYMVARGSQGNPWIFQELTQGESFVPPTLAELLMMIRFQVLEMLEFYGEDKGIRMARKIVLDYLRGRGFHGEWRGKAGTLADKADFLQYLQEAPLEHSEEYWKMAAADPNIERRLLQNC